MKEKIISFLKMPGRFLVKTFKVKTSYPKEICVVCRKMLEVEDEKNMVNASSVFFWFFLFVIIVGLL